MRLDSRRKFFYWYCSLRSNLRPGGLFVKCYPKNRKQFKFYSPSGRSFEIDAPTLNVERILSFYFRSTSKGKTISQIFPTKRYKDLSLTLQELPRRPKKEKIFVEVKRGDSLPQYDLLQLSVKIEIVQYYSSSVSRELCIFLKRRCFFFYEIKLGRSEPNITCIPDYKVSVIYTREKGLSHDFRRNLHTINSPYKRKNFSLITSTRSE